MSSQLNEIFPSMNNVGFSFPILVSCGLVYKHLYYKALPADSRTVGSKCCTLHLFQQIDTGVHWFQVSSQESLGVPTLHAIVVSIAK